MIRMNVALSLFVAGASAAALSSSAAAIIPGDSLYIRCRNFGGDYRISELNHAVSKYSAESRTYRPLCATCNVTRWGDAIAMSDGDGISVWIDRVKGTITVRNRDYDSGENGGPAPFSGICARGQRMDERPAPTPAQSTRRAF